MAGSFDACRVAFVGLVQSEEEKVRALPLYTIPKPAPEVVPSVEVIAQPVPEAAVPAADQTPETTTVPIPEATTVQTPATITPEEKKSTPEAQPAVEESRPRRRCSAVN